jgi:uncharacterized membrane protein YkoI
MFIRRSVPIGKASNMQRGGLALAFTLMICAPAIAAEPSPDHAQSNPQANAQANPQANSQSNPQTNPQPNPQEHAQTHPQDQQHAQEPKTQEHPQEHAHPPPERVCLTVAQAREKIALHKFAEPFRVTTFVAHHFQAETLRVKLCRRKDEFVYEISLLQKDGRVIRVYANAATGKIVRTVNTEATNAAAERQEQGHVRGRAR